MTERPPFSSVERSRRGHRDAGVVRSIVRRMTFGKRLQPPWHRFSFRHEKLRILRGALGLLLDDRFGNDVEAFLSLHDDEPRLLVGQPIGLSLTVEVDAATGLYVLYESGSRDDCLLVTASDERLVDHIVARVLRANGDPSSFTADSVTDMLVGRTLADVECRLLVRTLRHFRGDFTRAAYALGLPADILRARVRMLLRSGPPVPVVLEAQ